MTASSTEQRGKRPRGAHAALSWLGDHRVLAALLLSLMLAWSNLAATGRWASAPGALHGWRFPWYAGALGLATVAAVAWLRGRSIRPGTGLAVPLLAAGAGLVLLAGAFFSAFPPWTWRQIPFYDDWPGLMQIADDGIRLLERGAAVGWNWNFLGGYHTSADLGQSIALPAFVPIRLFGVKVGFHVLLAAFTALVPLAVYLDLGLERDRRLTLLATGITCLLTAGYFATVMRSGMANSVAGVGFVGLALAGSHAARLGRRWGGPLLVLALTLVLYSHAAFFVYASVYLALEAWFYRDWRMAARSAAALFMAFVAALPLHWELLRYPEYFRSNNLYWESPPAFDWRGFSRNVYYAAEILFRPGRWFNDYVGVAHVWLPAVVAVATLRRSRAVFYAWAALATLVMLRLNTPQLGIILAREMYAYPLLLGPVLAMFVAHLPARPAVAPAVLLALGFFVAVPFEAVPHVADVSVFNPALVDRVKNAPGGMVLLENNPHWNMIATPGQRSEPSRFDTHYEALLPAETGKRFFGQPQDGYHRSIFRDRVLAGGAFRGRSISDEPPERFAAELRRWGVSRLFVWSAPSVRVLDSTPLFRLSWRADPWREYTLVDADTRDVVTESGAGALAAYDGLGGDIALTDVRAGDAVVVRTNFFPAWTAQANGVPVPLVSSDGQLGFRAPSDGSYHVKLLYPRRTGWLLLAWGAVAAGVILLARRPHEGARTISAHGGGQ
jgi:hypothetical protein